MKEFVKVTSSETLDLRKPEVEKESEVLQEQESLGKVYLDFNYTREDNTNKFGKIRRGLETLLSILRKKHDNNLFKSWSAETHTESLLDYVLRNYFTEKMPVNFYISNLSLSDSYWRLMFRLQVGPRLQMDMPEGLTVAFIAEVKEEHSEQPSLTIRDIKVVAATELLFFERELQTEIALNKKAWEAKENNIINKKWLEALPKISKRTAEELASWYDYLNFKKQVVQHQELGVRYIFRKPRIDADNQQIQFIVGYEQGDNIVARIKRKQLSCFDIDASEDNWVFKPPIEQARGRRATTVRLGDFNEQESRSLSKDEAHEFLSRVDGSIASPQFYLMTFELHDDHKEELDKQQKTDDEVKSWIEKKFPELGFVAISTAGDKAQIYRHQKSLDQLKNQSGYNPMLSAFLFDINKARLPKEIKTLDSESFLNKKLNSDQKKSIEKILSAQDICMIQGPPGTGKTTVIAEAIYQLVKKGEKVLLVSQAHLAVDNALERLPLDPSIRALRLGPDNKISDGGKVFTQSQVLKRFYKSIDNKMYKSTLGVWEEIEHHQEQCRYYIDKLSGLIEDLNENNNIINNFNVTLKEEQKLVKSLQKNFKIEQENYYKHLSNQERASNALRALKNKNWSAFYLPESIFSSVSTEVNKLLLELRNSGLTMGLPLPKQSEELSIHVDVLKRWLVHSEVALENYLHISEELNRLKSGEGLEDTATALELIRLKGERDKLTTLLQSGEEVIEKWREIGSKIKSLEGEKSGLNTDIYQKLVSEDSILLNPDSPKSNVIQNLEILIQGIEILNEKRPFLLADIDKKISNLTAQKVPEPNQRSVNEALAIIENQQQQLSQWQERSTVFKNKIAILLQQAAGDLKLSISYENYEASIQILEAKEEDCRNNLSNNGIRKHWQSTLEDWHEILTADDISTDNENFLNDFITHCNVIAITCNESEKTLDNIGAESFDTVIVDEVSKATPPELLASIMKARRVVLVGDHRQLPPVFQERHDETWEEAAAKAEEEGEESLLTKEQLKKYEKMVTSSLFKQHFEEADDSIKSSLFTQYRMHPQIMDLINVFYENRLICGLVDYDKERDHGLTIGSAKHKSLSFIHPGRHAYWINSSHLPNGQVFHEQQAGTSKINLLEVELIVQTLRKLNAAQQELVLNNKIITKKSVGVISFYGRQVKSLRAAIRPLRTKLEYLDIDINTVDQFQGKEEDIIMVSMVRNTPSGRSGSGAYVAQFERINVAFSRARELLMIFGAKEMFSDYEVSLPNLDRPGKNKRRVYRDIIVNLESNASVFESDALLNVVDDHKIIFDLQNNQEINKKEGFKKYKKRI